MATPVLRIAIAQELVPHYRVPFFDRLAQVPGVALTVLADGRDPAGSLKPSTLRQAAFEQADHRTLGPFFWQAAPLAHAARGSFDLLILNWNIRRLEQVPALLTARARGIGTIVWGHGYSKNERRSLRAIRDRVGALADATLFYAEPAAQAYAARGHAPDRIFVAPNAIDQAPIDEARRSWLERQDELASFALQQGLRRDRTVLFLARLEPIKRIHLLLEAFVHVRAAMEDARLVLVGAGPEEAALRAQAAALGIEGAVIFKGAIHDQAELAPWALQAAAAAFPADVGLSLLHCFGFGLPMITDGAVERHNPEIAALEPGVNGLFFESGNQRDLADQILRIFRDPALQQRLSAGALQSVQGAAGFTLDRMVDGFVRAIDFVAGLHGKRR